MANTFVPSGLKFLAVVGNPALTTVEVGWVIAPPWALAQCSSFKIYKSTDGGSTYSLFKTSISPNVFIPLETTAMKIKVTSVNAAAEESARSDAFDIFAATVVPPVVADQILFDNTASGLSATQMQAAIDELSAALVLLTARVEALEE